MKKQLVFSQEEYRERVRRTQERMDHQGLELLLVTDPGHMNE